jgi:hypothetical protein
MPFLVGVPFCAGRLIQSRLNPEIEIGETIPSVLEGLDNLPKTGISRRYFVLWRSFPILSHRLFSRYQRHGGSSTGFNESLDLVGGNPNRAGDLDVADLPLPNPATDRCRFESQSPRNFRDS